MGFFKKAIGAGVGYLGAKSLIKEAKKTQEEKDRKAYSTRLINYSFTIPANINKEELINIIKEIEGCSSGEIEDEEENETISFVKGSALLGNKTITKIDIKNLGKGFHININSSRHILFNKFTFAEEKEIKENYVKLEENIKNLIG
ncbi:MAG: hypothetical protein KKF56_05725 [Nanoarchaeota archaeon]|nr:hypothetical protein [Nanoarchaeota archaeon]